MSVQSTTVDPVLSVSEVKAQEQAWAAAHQGSTWPLMQRAGDAVVTRLRALWPGVESVWVLCGPGNNGGDGYIAACSLAKNDVSVQVVAPLGLPREGSDARRAYLDFVESGGVALSEVPEGRAEVLVDALLGTGHRGRLDDSLQTVIRVLQQRCSNTLAVDIPSGLDAATGCASPGAVRADQTVSFIALKPGLLTAQGPSVTGVMTLATLDVAPLKILRPSEGDFYQRAPAPWPERPVDAHKGRFGAVRVVAGGEMMGGAGLLAAQAALHSGAGRVYWHTSLEHRQGALVAQPELMMADLEQPLADPEARYVVGPGLGQSMVALRHYETIAAGGFSGVFDADGLTWLASQSVQLPEWVLTPHPGEAARLLSCSVDEVQADRFAAARAIYQAYGATTVLKGAGSIIADNEGRVIVHPGTAAMATPGMGDCLAGMIAALMAQGFTPREAAVAGADRHARLAAQLAQRQRIVLASDVIQNLRSAPQA